MGGSHIIPLLQEIKDRPLGVREAGVRSPDHVTPKT